jgi:hypothetical protein
MGLAAVRRHEEVPQTRGLGLGLQLLDDLHDLPALLAEDVHLGFVAGDRGDDVLVHERGDAIKELPLLGGDVEIHGASQSRFLASNACLNIF